MKRNLLCALALLLFASLTVTGAKLAETDSLRRELVEAAHDTGRVKALFGLGNRFVDGPSDSLLFFYHRALQLIDENISALSENQNSDKTLKTFRQLRLRALIELGIEYFFRSEYDKALGYYSAAAEQANALNDRSHLSECYGELGILYKNQGKYDTALKYQQKALEIGLTLGEPDWVAICNNNIGNIYKARGYYAVALDYYLKALKTFEDMNQPRRVAACMHSVGDLLFQQENYEKALEYFEKTLKLAQTQGDRLRESNMYMAIGNVRSRENQPDAARQNYLRALEIYDSLGYRHKLDDCYRWIGNTWLTQGNVAQAENYYREALNFSDQEGDQTGRAETLNQLGQVFIQKKDYTQARKLIGESLEMAQQLQAPTIAMAAYHNLYKTDTASGRSGQALDHYIQYASIKDSLFRAEQFRVITDMEFKYETGRKEQDIALLTEQTRVQELKIDRRNRMLWMVAAFFVLVLGSGYFFYQNRRLKAVHRASELQNRLLRSQMNPHFIFNALIAIQGFIYEKKPVEAGDFLARFADLVRLTLENSRTGFVALQKEIGMIRVYLELQRLRFDEQFDFELEIDPALDAENIMIPPMLAQPFIENAVEHGIRNKPEKGFIRVAISGNEYKIEMIVEDDGIGREAAQKFRKPGKPGSLATSITSERLKVLGRKYHQKFLFEIEDLKDENNNPAGTRVRVQMPAEKAGLIS